MGVKSRLHPPTHPTGLQHQQQLAHRKKVCHRALKRWDGRPQKTRSKIHLAHPWDPRLLMGSAIPPLLRPHPTIQPADHHQQHNVYNRGGHQRSGQHSSCSKPREQYNAPLTTTPTHTWGNHTHAARMHTKCPNVRLFTKGRPRRHTVV